MTEQNIIAGLKIRERKSLDAFNRKYASFLYSIASKVLKNKMDAEDVVQECFLKVLAGVVNFNTENSFKGWLYKIAHLSAITYYNRENKRRNYQDIDGYEPMQVRASSFIDSFMARDDYRKASMILRDLAPGQYMYTRLYFEEQMSYEEISKDLEVPVGSVKSQVSRGAAQIRSILMKLDNVQLMKNIA